ncbi:MAG TPA: tripartite tricarboxylate transporter substrate-binding protein [Pelagibacterium sp.]|uniref:Bug family tripartite tricarboxylate transporter substrate binding protein n=1 Tax=Pelagibacterium sp. TaxID=1967288 RepID=UPI002D08AB93|nr:tripartite tricarboxylate transporter substrate-binding protein [Pelagibacterium sp.]HWJ87955.1 tripartite tricarboxylate transporter substrate-binding protein [Pelagibacterium sp.]
MKHQVRMGGALGLALAALLAGSPVWAQDSVEDFYRGKSIDMIIGYSPGGGYDQYARLVARHLGKYIPGNPEIVPRNMPGAGGLLAASFMYNVAPQDGTILGTSDQSLAVSQAMGDPRITLDTSEFGYVGSPAMENNVLVTWHTSGIDTVDAAREQPSAIGATGGSTSWQYPTIMNALLGTQFEIITGYPGGNDINFAMESGEVDGRGSVNWASVKPLGWVERGLVNVLVQIGLQRESELPDVPLLFELAENEDDEQLLRLLSAPTAIGRPIFTTPNVPEERLKALQDAFDQMVADPEFIAAAAQENLGIIPVSGEQLRATVEEILAMPPEVTSRLAEFIATE